MRIVLLVAVLFASTLLASAQDIRMPAPTLPMGAPVGPAPNVVPPPIPPDQLSPIPPSLKLPEAPTNQTVVPGAGGDAPYDKPSEVEAPRCYCTAPNPVDGSTMITKCAPECCV